MIGADQFVTCQMATSVSAFSILNIYLIVCAACVRVFVHVLSYLMPSGDARGKIF